MAAPSQMTLPQAPFQGTWQGVLNVAAGTYSNVLVETTISQPDTTNSADSLTLTAEWTTDNQNWQPLASDSWKGAATNTGKFGAAPGIDVPFPATSIGLRVTLNVPSSMQVGCQATLS